MTPETVSTFGQHVVGIDEAGRGPLAGPVMAAAVILPFDIDYPTWLKDSKALSKKKREIAYQWILEHAICFGFGAAEAYEIDQMNIHRATLLAMQRAAKALHIAPDYALVDGKFLPKDLGCPGRAVIKGDQLVHCISAASILAKVRRDRIMHELDLDYPEYGFAKHSGYGTKEHMMAIKEYGVSPYHRTSYAPCRVT